MSLDSMRPISILPGTNLIWTGSLRGLVMVRDHMGKSLHA
jgi:hypothetical protein